MLFASELLEELNKQGVYNTGFADDINIIAISKTTKGTCWQLERVHKICLSWAKRHGAKFAPEKYKVIHFTRKKLKEIERDRISNIGIESKPVKELRLLGVIVDNKLIWKPHI